jgi:hypothetical protein
MLAYVGYIVDKVAGSGFFFSSSNSIFSCILSPHQFSHSPFSRAGGLGQLVRKYQKGSVLPTFKWAYAYTVYGIVTYLGVCDYRRGMDWILGLLTTIPHNLQLQLIIRYH